MNLLRLFFLFQLILYFSIANSQTSILDGDAILVETNEGSLDSCMVFTQGSLRSGAIWLKDRHSLENGFDVTALMSFGNEDGQAGEMVLLLQTDGFDIINKCKENPLCADTSLNIFNEYWGIQLKMQLTEKDSTTYTSYDLINLVSKNKEDSTQKIIKSVPASFDSTNLELPDTFHLFRVTWDSEQNHLQIYLNGKLRISQCVDLVGQFDDPNVFIGMLGIAKSKPVLQKVCVSEWEFACCEPICQPIVDLNITNGWKQLGQPDNGHWVTSRSQGTKEIIQTINSAPTIYALPAKELINVKITFDIEVNNNSKDNDAIGCVWGLKDPICDDPEFYDMWLFSWRNRNDTACNKKYIGPEGYTLAKVNGKISPGCEEKEWIDYFWGHRSDSVFQVKGKKWGEDFGWEHGQKYEITLIYTKTEIIILVNNEEIFRYIGIFEPGAFGFYNFSQANTIYSNFKYEMYGSFDTQPQEICQNVSSVFKFTNQNETQFDTCLIESLIWDFGDDKTVFSDDPYSFNSVDHTYKETDTFHPFLTINDTYGCEHLIQGDSIIVHSFQPPNLGVDTTICNDTILLKDASYNQSETSSYLWQDGSSTPTHVLSNSGIFWVEISTPQCKSRDSIKINITSLPEIRIETKPSCYLQNNGSINLSINKIAAPYSLKLNDIIINDGNLFDDLTPGFYELLITDNNQCDFQEEIYISEAEVEKIEKLIYPISCFGADDAMLSLIDSNQKNLYSLNGIDYSHQTEYDYLSPNAYKLFFKDSLGCIYTDSFFITSPDFFLIELIAPKKIDLGDEIIVQTNITGGNGNISFSWEGDQIKNCFECKDLPVKPSKTSEYKIKAIDSKGCTTENQIKIIVDRREKDCLPNIFSPNGDGINDIIKIEFCKNVALIKKWQVFDRWGNLYFTANNFLPGDPSFGWDGFYKSSKALNGVYLSLLEVELVDGTNEKYTSDFLLKR